MYLSSLMLKNFRNHLNAKFSFSSNCNIIYGQNGSGKSNILEAIYVLSTGKSFLPHTISELITWENTYSLVSGQIQQLDGPTNLEVQLIREPTLKTSTRKFLLDTVPKPRSKYLGQFKLVVFQPDDLRLITGSPTRRREYLDQVLSSFSWQYHAASLQYTRALKHRNVLLDLIFNGKASPEQLFIWDQSLIKNGEFIQSQRQKFIAYLNSFFQFNLHLEIQKLSLLYLPSLISNHSLLANRELDIRRGSTSLGPHRDDFLAQSNLFHNLDRALLHWGSRGQQRLAVLAMKLGEIEYLKELHQSNPVLLLDDIFSELDHEHKLLVTNLSENYQTIYTSSDLDIGKILPKAQIINLTL